VEDELVPVCKELDITIVAYSPLARNLLATKLEEAPKDWRAKLPRYSKENFGANRKIVEKLEELAAKYNGTTAQLSLAWLFHKANELGVAVVPIPGSTKLSHAISNLDSTKIEISDEDTATLEGLAAQVAGARGGEDYTGIAIEAQD
jgi:aryl-alcohol dehydrogenase-like predicted oxidoreductase